ncbi:MAG: type II secretion system F family protein [Ilumatobacter sp.]
MDVAVWVDEVARSLRHGATLGASLAELEPVDVVVAELTAPLRHHLERGATVVEACDAWIAGLDHRRGHHLLAVGAVLAATALVGGSGSEALDRAAGVMRGHAAADLEREAQSAQAKLSAKVLTIIPLALLAVMVMADAEVRSVLATPSGAGTVAAGIAANAVGLWWMRVVARPRHGGLRST